MIVYSRSLTSASVEEFGKMHLSSRGETVDEVLEVSDTLTLHDVKKSLVHGDVMMCTGCSRLNVVQLLSCRTRQIPWL